MGAEQKIDQKKFFIRLVSTTAAVVLVLYVAKVWFVDKSSPRVSSEELKPQQEYNVAPAQSDIKETSIPVISWQEANKHYGEYVTVEGKIVATYNSGKACFLNFHPNYKRYFTAVIFASAFSRFPPNPESYYDGKTVRVTGYIKEYKGKPEIILNDPEQIEVLR